MVNQRKVLIVGAGPTGLMMGALLHEYGIPFDIIDKKEGPSVHSKALGIQPRSLELLDRLGLAETFIEQGTQVSKVFFHSKKRIIGHVNFTGLNTPYPYILSLPQSKSEEILIDHLEKRGVEVEWKTEYQGKGEYDYLIGCDGPKSFVREMAGLSFKGKEFKSRFALADFHIKRGIDPHLFHLFFVSEGALGLIPLGGDRMRLVVSNTDPDDPLDLESFTHIVKARTGHDIEFDDLEWASHFYTHFRKAESLRKGSVFLLGDAAHVHSPIGGQGMNTGWQDAANLAWKLSFVIKGQAKPSLLDTFNEERLTIAKRLLDWTHGMTELATLKGAASKIRNGVLSYLLKRVSFQNMLKRRISQLDINYRFSSLAIEKRPTVLTTPFSKKRRLFALGPRAGDRALDAPIKVEGEMEIASLFALQRKVPMLLLIFSTDELTPSELTTYRSTLPACITPYLVVDEGMDDLKENWQDGIVIDEMKSLRKHYGGHGACVVLIRPDGYIAFRSMGLTSVPSESLGLL